MRARLWLLRAALTVFSVAAVLAACEVFVRAYKPTPATQIIAERGGLEFWSEGGVPMWREHERREQQNEECARLRPKSRKILFFGPSIFWGSGLPDGVPSFTQRLQARLDEAEPGRYCVMNFAQPGYHHAQNVALAERLIPLYRPELVFWCIWSSEPAPYTLLGRRAYDLSQLGVPPGSYPDAFHLPTAANRFLFERSRLYEYLTLQLLRKLAPALDARRAWERFAHRDMPEMIRSVRGLGGVLVPVLCPQMDRPFSEWRQAPDESIAVPALAAMAGRERVPVLLLGDLLGGQDYRQLRFDSHYHFNDAGHEVLAEIFFRWIMRHDGARWRGR